MRKTDKRPKGGRARCPKKWMKIEDGYSVLVISYQKWIYTDYASMKVNVIKRWPPKTILRRAGWR